MERRWFQKNIFSDPVGWAEHALARTLHYRIAQLFCLFGGFSCGLVIWLLAQLAGIESPSSLLILPAAFCVFLPLVYLHLSDARVRRLSSLNLP